MICGAEQVSALFCKASDGLQDETAHGGKERMECPHDTTANAAFFLIKNQYTDQSSGKFLGAVGLNIIF